MGKTWTLRTWTKGTGAFVEPLDPSGQPTGKARPGGFVQAPRRPWNRSRTWVEARVDRHRTDSDARRRHARRHMDEPTVERLEELERQLANASGEGDVAA
ncbi:MAG: hypothetical protein ACXVR1_16255 [Solirubrobacteraceae bacterium]